MKNAQIWVTDKSGRKMWNTICSPHYVAPERRNLERHLARATQYPKEYAFLDIATARIECEGEANTALEGLCTCKKPTYAIDASMVGVAGRV